MTEQSETVIWEGSVDHGKWIAKVVGIPNSETRATLQIFDSSGSMRYQREVGASYSSDYNANARYMKEWSSIILNWVDNNS